MWERTIRELCFRITGRKSCTEYVIHSRKSINPCNFCDNFFTSHLLLHNLQQKGFRAVGTVRNNKTEKCTVKSSKELNKMHLSTYYFQFDEKKKQ